MIIGLTGATGLIGQRVRERALAAGHRVIAFTRAPTHFEGEARLFATDGSLDLSGCEVVIHLAGESVIGRWTKAKRDRIRASRIEGTRAVVTAIDRLGNAGPRALVCGSAIGFYGEAGDAETDETAASGAGFLAETCGAWEAEALRFAGRLVLLRTGVVLGRNGGALPVMLPIFRSGLAGKIGSGRQWFSWIHHEDIARLALFVAMNEKVRGPVNGTAPEPVRNADFTRTLAGLLHRPAFLTAPAVAVRAALGEAAGEVLASKRIVPRAALAAGFAFQFPSLAAALRDLLSLP